MELRTLENNIGYGIEDRNWKWDPVLLSPLPPLMGVTSLNPYHYAYTVFWDKRSYSYLQLRYIEMFKVYCQMLGFKQQAIHQDFL